MKHSKPGLQVSYVGHDMIGTSGNMHNLTFQLNHKLLHLWIRNLVVCYPNYQPMTEQLRS